MTKPYELENWAEQYQKMANVIEALEDDIYDILKGNCTEEQWDQIISVNPGMVTLKPTDVIRIIELIYIHTQEVRT